MKNKKIITFISIFIIAYIISFYLVEYKTKNYLNHRFYSNNWLLTYPLDIELNKGNCELIKTYSDIKIKYSPIKNDNLEKLKIIYNKCSDFDMDLRYLNSINMANPNYFNKDESSFLYYTVKYYYYLDKNYILKEIKNNKFDSEISLLLIEKIK